MKKLSNYFWLSIGFGCLMLLIFKISKRFLTDHFLQTNPQLTKAIIIGEKNFMGNQPVAPRFSYSYKFMVNGITYIGDSHDSSRNIGDTVEVEYDGTWPSFNKPLHPKE